MGSHSGYIKMEFTTDDVSKAKTIVKIGDKLRYKTVQQDILNEKISHVVWEKVIIKQKYDHLVEVEYTDRPNTWPVKTMTYKEVAFQKVGIDYDELRGKRK